MKLCACLVFMVKENTSQIRNWNYFTVESIRRSYRCCFLLWI